MDQLKTKVICEGIMILGCCLLIVVYISGFIGMFITPNIYFSDFLDSTTITMLTCALLFFIVQNYNANSKLLEEKKKIKEERKGEVIIN